MYVIHTNNWPYGHWYSTMFGMALFEYINYEFKARRSFVKFIKISSVCLIVLGCASSIFSYDLKQKKKIKILNSIKFYNFFFFFSFFWTYILSFNGTKKKKITYHQVTWMVEWITGQVICFVGGPGFHSCSPKQNSSWPNAELPNKFNDLKDNHRNKKKQIDKIKL